MHGVSTRNVDDQGKALGSDTEVSKTEVSRICDGPDEVIRPNPQETKGANRPAGQRLYAPDESRSALTTPRFEGQQNSQFLMDAYNFRIRKLAVLMY
ncbi:hypothetical protein GCM10022295_89400 [Streptomyces osmaniensis]|uniref:Transposase n=1 Tax=Streptomyces osmaniensis TaxID=593134 RepID=A0ABP6Z0M2_9ACTN